MASVLSIAGVGFAFSGADGFTAWLRALDPDGPGSQGWTRAAAAVAPFGAATGCLIGASLIGIRKERPYYRVTWRAGAWFLLAVASWQAAAVAARVGIDGQAFTFVAIASLVTWAFMRYGAMAFAVATRHAQAPALDVLQRDRRAPVLYLRSFSADAEPAPGAYRLALRWARGLWQGAFLSPAFWARQRAWSFEEVLCEGMRVTGPVVAVGRPGERLPRPGAARMYLNDEEWESGVATLAREARLVFLLLGSSAGLLWELSLIAKHAWLPKAVLVFPPDVSAGRVWTGFLAAVGDRSIRDLLPATVADQTIAVMFDEHGAPVTVAGQQTIENYRRLAYYASHAGAPGRAPWEPNPSWRGAPGEIATVASIKAGTRVSLVSVLAINAAVAPLSQLGALLGGTLGRLAGASGGLLLGVTVELVMLSLLLGVNWRTLLVCRGFGPEARIESLCNRLLYAQKRFDVVYAGSRRLAQQLTDDLLKALNALSWVPWTPRLSDATRVWLERVEEQCRGLIEQFEAQSDLNGGSTDTDRRDAMLELCARADRLADEVVAVALLAGSRP